ncbi:membrane protein FxsA [Cohnella sp. CFH 77786]|uniref:FxsA family protein n=1 Tax=Cohnella sp. CFH 77786 TaxID=2662265 RepID=UPI001C610135|nr:FxsA family protein [Cohnella sp. CFH 77786]MBW5447426.1 membrane protein FxsA [Cohnella sp. CFH 77786]
MYRWLLALMIIVPAAELWGIIQVGHWIGGWQTFGLLLLTGFGGAWLARSEGRKVWLDAQRQLQSGQMPGRALLDGLCVLVGGLLLMMPGFFTDLVGVTLLLPITRPLYRLLLYGWLERKIRSGSLSIRRGPRRW